MRRGYLVPAAGIVPDDPHEFSWLRRQPRVGCNHIVCSQCGVEVRQEPHFFLRYADRTEEVWSTEDWSSLDFLDQLGFSKYRLYVCRCSHVNRQFEYALDTEDRGPGPGSTWACAGHPQPTPVPTWTIDELADRFATDLTTWKPGDAGSPLDRADRLHGQFQTDPLAVRVGQAMALLLEHDDPFVRGGAIAFFHGRGAVPGYMGLIDAALRHRHLYADVTEPSPSPAGPTLEHRLFLALSTLLPYEVEKRDQVVEALREAMLRPGFGAGLLRPMLSFDGAWVRQRAGAIAAANPDTLAPMLANMQWGRGFEDWVVDLASHEGVDREVLRAAVTSSVASPRRERILDRLP